MIKTEADAQAFFFQLEQQGKLFHPEDDPSTVIDQQGNPLFTPDEVILMRQRIDEVYEVMDDPCAYILTLDTYRTVTDGERSCGF